ncbi:MAG: glycosyltransferase family 2 protein [Bryobacteraceae bacterium]|jgi:glycosyltransferase involved in cell wall biosynthesis
MGPAISVVIPLWNKATTVRRCLESVVRQTFQDFEVVVVDDGSTDGGGDIARQVMDPRIRVVSQPNRGAAAARNRGLEESQARCVAFLDGDDEWAPQFLAAIMGLIERFPRAGMYVTGLRHSWEKEGYYEDISFVLPGEGDIGQTDEYFAAPWEAHGMASGSSTAIRKEVVDVVGAFPVGEPMGQEVDLWVRIAARYPVAFDRRILAIYHRDEGQREGRRASLKWPYPPAIRSLRKVVEAGGLPPDKLAQIKRFVDYRAMENVYWQAWLKLPSTRQVILEEPYYTWRYRLEGALLRWGVRILSPKMLYRLRWIPVAAVRKLKRLFFGSPDVVVGRVFVRRRMPATTESQGAGSPELAPHMTSSAHDP